MVSMLLVIPLFQVGGEFSNTVIAKHMKLYGRIAIIGSISGYNATSPRTGKKLPHGALLNVKSNTPYTIHRFPLV